MVALRLSGLITEDGQLIVQLPQDVPGGPVEVVIQAQQLEQPTPVLSARERVRHALETAGLLSYAARLMPPIAPPNAEEVLKAGQLPPNARPTHELIDEDRNER